jgi:quercetin dioxygenase-like cupin family protein
MFSDDLFASLDLDAIARELLESARADADGKAARTLFKSTELTVLVTALRAGAALQEHAAPGPVTILPLVGRVDFEAPTRSETASIEGARMLAMSPGLRHAVTASEDAAFLLIIGGRPTT